MGYSTLAGSTSVLERQQPTLHLNTFRDIKEMRLFTVRPLPCFVYLFVALTRLFFIEVLTEIHCNVQVGIWWELFNDTSADRVEANYVAAQTVLKAIESRGAKVMQVPQMPIWNAARAAFKAVSLMETSQFMDRVRPSERPQLADTTRAKLALGGAFTARDLLSASKVRARTQLQVTKLLGQVDVMITPAVGRAAPVIESADDFDPQLDNDMTKFTWLANFIGLPAATVPIGVTDDGLPMSLHLVAAPWNEHRLLRLANAIESMDFVREAFSDKQPELFFSMLTGVVDCEDFVRPENAAWGDCPKSGVLGHNSTCLIECKAGYEIVSGKHPFCLNGQLISTIECSAKACSTHEIELPLNGVWGTCGGMSYDMRAEAVIASNQSCSLACAPGFSIVGQHPSCSLGVLTYNVSCNPICDGFNVPNHSFLGSCRGDVDECASYPCENNGTCLESSRDMTIPTGSVRCTCPEGWKGQFCEDSVDDCTKPDPENPWVQPRVKISIGKAYPESHFRDAVSWLVDAASGGIIT